MTNKEKAARAAYMRDYMKRAPKDVLMRKRTREEEWVRKNLERVRARKKRWYDDNKERLNSLRRGNPEVLARAKEYRQSSFGKANKKRAKSAERGAPVCSLTAVEWRKILNKFNGLCAYCQNENSKVEQEHVTPISRGGNHDKNNVVPSCRRCNLAKGTRTLKEWIDDLKKAARG